MINTEENLKSIFIITADSVTVFSFFCLMIFNYSYKHTYNQNKTNNRKKTDLYI